MGFVLLFELSRNYRRAVVVREIVARKNIYGQRGENPHIPHVPRVHSRMVMHDILSRVRHRSGKGILSTHWKYVALGPDAPWAPEVYLGSNLEAGSSRTLIDTAHASTFNTL